MNFLCSFIAIFCIFFKLTAPQQSYDPTPCSSSDEFLPGSRYTCKSFTKSCTTFLVYRSQDGCQTISKIAELLNIDENRLLEINKVASASQVLERDRDVLIPINCSCSGEFFQSNFTYIVPKPMTYDEIACGIFEGLLKSRVLLLANPFLQNVLINGTKLYVPLKCACPENATSSEGFEYLVTYPFIRGDGTDKLGKKFGIPVEEIWQVNAFKERPTVYPKTTFLVPVKRTPSINFNYSDYQAQNPVSTPMFSAKIINASENPKNLNAIGAVMGAFFLFVVVCSGGFYIRKIKEEKARKLEASIARRTEVSYYSPDVVVRMCSLKYSPYNYSIWVLREATNNFSEDTKICSSTYKGRIGDSEVMVKQMSFDEACRIIYMHSKINHSSIVRLLGMCYDEGDCSQSYLVFEFAKNGCLRGCLSDPSNVLQWQNRMHIAHDVAIGLHYLHHCSIPSYVHMGISSRNILIAEDGRAKIANFGTAFCIDSSNEQGSTATNGCGWIAPEYYLEGSVSAKVDIFAFGVVLLELISGKEALDGSFFKEPLRFLRGNASEGNQFEKLRSFMDPRLKEDYPLGEAMCMAILAKACVEDDAKHRPSMNDILMILARMG